VSSDRSAQNRSKVTPDEVVQTPSAVLFCAIGFAASGGSGTVADVKAELEKEAKKFQGTWTFESSVTGGDELPADHLKMFVVTFEGDKHTVKKGDEVIQVGTQLFVLIVWGLAPSFWLTMYRSTAASTSIFFRQWAAN
jgi:hypothetical protein